MNLNRVAFPALSLALFCAGLTWAPAQVSAEELASSAKTVQAPHVDWQAYDEGLKAAKTKQKFVLVEFFATWCPYCRKMDQTTFKDPAVLSSLERWFVPIRVTEKSQNQVWFQGQKMTEDQVLNLHKVTGFPTLMLLTPEGKKLATLPGYKEPEEMAMLLKFVGSKAYEKMDFQTFMAQEAKTAGS